MTKKDYEAIAAAIAQAKMSTTDDGYSADTIDVAIYRVATNLASIMIADNERFDRAKFLRACGV